MSLVNDPVVRADSPRLSEVLFERGTRSFVSLAALPSNVEAIEAGLLFAAGLTSFVAVVGPSGWGKSHLLDSVGKRLRRDEPDAPEPMPAGAALANSHWLDTPRPLLLDDAQEVLSKPRQKMMLRVGLEKRLRQGRRTFLVFTLPKPTRALRNFLPNPRDWTVATMGAAERDERVLLLNQLSAAEGLSLSPRLIHIVANQMHGNGRTFSGALNRLRLSGAEWLDSRSTLRACGLLTPFFADNTRWDLEHKILRVAEGSRQRFSRVNPLDLALYTMLHEAGLPEAAVARAADVTPADAFGRATRFRNQIQEDDGTAANVRQFVDMVVESLAAE